VRGGKGPYELPPSRGWPCSVENNLFSKQREAHYGMRQLNFFLEYFA
jgi:hypothetical protein